MERVIILAPALVPVAYFLVALVVYSGLCLIGQRPDTGERRKHSRFFYFFIDYFLWMLRPVERALLKNPSLTPNHLTFTSLAACASSGLAIATGHMATAGWLYIFAGALDVLDGRLARATGHASKAGAFLDSVTDRWCELFVFTGFAWFLHDTGWLFAVMAAASGSIMVSYTRARGEALGIALDGGAMQRAERIALVAIGTLITAWFNAAHDTREYGIHVIGVALLIVGVGSSATAVSRWIQGYRMLRDAEGQSPQPRTRESATSPLRSR
ncbi:MAG TPA: CDP-alcohol phosphatidyltransferase family protein [Kofleriaceae bacterium]|nr:CDP-alcohol phosphatidyltransferase family protein [Kofleriaceae bacterium]